MYQEDVSTNARVVEKEKEKQGYATQAMRKLSVAGTTNTLNIYQALVLKAKVHTHIYTQK